MKFFLPIVTTLISLNKIFYSPKIEVFIFFIFYFMIPWFVSIIRENKKLPHLPIEIWFMIQECITLLVILEHERRFNFRIYRIVPFQRCFMKSFPFIAEHRSNCTIRQYTRLCLLHRVVHFHDLDETIVYSTFQNDRAVCRNRLREVTCENHD